MKKLIFILLLIVFAFEGRSQRKQIKISELKIGELNCIYAMSANLETQDTIRYIYMGFPNAKYSHITDIKSIMLRATKDSADVFEFKKDLIAALPEIGTKTNMSWDRKNYTINLFESSKDLLLYKESGYTGLKKDQVEKLIDWIDAIGFKNK